jgi:hypothetical protein
MSAAFANKELIPIASAAVPAFKIPVMVAPESSMTACSGGDERLATIARQTLFQAPWCSLAEVRAISTANRVLAFWYKTSRLRGIAKRP